MGLSIWVRTFVRFLRNILHLKKNIICFQNFHNFFLSLKYKYTIRCNYLNKYTNLSDAHYIRYTSLWNLYKKCIPYLSGIFSKLCSNKKKKKVTMVSKHTLVQISLVKWTIYASIQSKKVFFLKFNAKKEGKTIPPSLNF